ncbi:hypothetical protein JL720_1293 [Aureococcus anophagefferens]|nr:hypothetical protein JL720_1293 [Aureococcus anophagefferens]
MVDAYLTRVDTIANYSGATDGSRHGGLTGERHLLNTLQIHNVAVARMYEFCLRRECMRDQPRCDVGVGCYQRGVHRQSRLFDGTDWCNNPRKDYACKYDFKKLGFLSFSKEYRPYTDFMYE